MPAHTHTTRFPDLTSSGRGWASSYSGWLETEGVPTTSIGANAPHENRPPFFEVVWIIKVK